MSICIVDSSELPSPKILYELKDADGRAVVLKRDESGHRVCELRELVKRIHQW